MSSAKLVEAFAVCRGYKTTGSTGTICIMNTGLFSSGLEEYPASWSDTEVEIFEGLKHYSPGIVSFSWVLYLRATEAAVHKPEDF